MQANLVTQIVRTVMQLIWSVLGAWGLESLIDSAEFELWLTGLVTALLVAALSWAERKLPWLGKLFVFAKTPEYEETQ
ncbi:unnamed protein product [marine sediment metagenome]|uniref:Uncharacterized protein n=1 Tax=marine sediment metagenome TaxID=412755 RepID=X0WGP0_9ZZZZ